MPNKPLKPCKHPGCIELVALGYCDNHKPERTYDDNRGTAAQRGYDARWRRYRLKYLRENPLCVACLAVGRFTPSTVVDHIKDHKGNRKLFWDTTNHQALCKRCHDSKTARTNPMR